MAGRCLTPYPTDGQHWCSRSFGHSGAHVNTTIDVTWLDDAPAAVVDVPVGSPAYRLINELTAEREALQARIADALDMENPEQFQMALLSAEAGIASDWSTVAATLLDEVLRIRTALLGTSPA